MRKTNNFNLIFMLTPQQSMHSRGIKFQCFLIYVAFKEQLSVSAPDRSS